MDEEQIRELVARGNELRGVEFKSAGLRTDKPFLARVARAAIAMSNRRDGGVIVIGIDDGPPPSLQGLTPAQSATWLYDDVSATLAEYAEPNVQFEVHHLRVDGKAVVVLSVREFEQIPIFCKKDYQNTLRRGAVYVRSHRMPESVEVPGYVEMRDLMDLATEKALRGFVATAQRSGIEISRSEGVSPFDAELGDYA